MNFILPLWKKEELPLILKAKPEGVILPIPFFSVRKMNAFSFEEVSEIIPVLKQMGIKAYVPFNRFFVESELETLKEGLKKLKELQVDYIYFTDEGVLQCAKELKMEQYLIYQPDTLITNALDAQYYLNEGIARVCLSREITLDEIKQIASKVEHKEQLEVMIHGRMPMMHSKRELLTSYMTFLKRQDEVKNKFTLSLREETREDRMPIIEDEHGTHVYSGFTLASFEEIKQLDEAGIQYGRMETMFHDAKYEIETLQLYRDVLNGVQSGSEVQTMYQDKYQEDHVTHGFYYTKTSKTK